MVLKQVLKFALISLLTLSFFSCKTEVSGKDNPDTAPKEEPPVLLAQGDVALEAITIGEQTFKNTKQIAIIAENQIASITGSAPSFIDKNHSSFNTYSGVFVEGRNVELSPYILSAYEVTQELYNKVMGENPSSFNDDASNGEEQDFRPVDSVSWYDCIIFCNELTKLTMDESDCVYYSDQELTQVFTKQNIENIEQYFIAGQFLRVYMDTSKKGYRLPTEAEWEFAARGGNPESDDWNYAFSGINTSVAKNIFPNGTDTNIGSYAWHDKNSNSKTHQVGLKESNCLGLYDMSGNVQEWCYDGYNNSVTAQDSSYTGSDNIVKNPLGFFENGASIIRGGSYDDTYASNCVTSRNYDEKNPDVWWQAEYTGFRLARSL